jgi:hypothetical protein
VRHDTRYVAEALMFRSIFAGETLAVQDEYPISSKGLQRDGPVESRRLVDSPRYGEIRAQIMSSADDACGLSAESSL